MWELLKLNTPEDRDAFLDLARTEQEDFIQGSLLDSFSGSVMDGNVSPKTLKINQTQFNALFATTDFSKFSDEKKEAYVKGELTELSFDFIDNNGNTKNISLPLQQPDHTVPDLMRRIENYGQALVEGTQAIGIQLYNNAKSAALASRLQGVMGHLYATVYNAETLDR